MGPEDGERTVVSSEQVNAIRVRVNGRWMRKRKRKAKASQTRI